MKKSIALLFISLFFYITQVSAAPTYRAFVTDERGDTLTVIDTRTYKVEKTLTVGKRPRGIGLSPDGTRLYVAVSAENKIAVVDPKTLKVLRKIPAGSDPETFAVHPNGHLYISNEDDAQASVVDPNTGKLIAEIPVGIEPEGVAVAPNGEKVIVTSESTNMLHVIAVPEHQLIANILVGSRPREAHFTADSQFAFASAEIGGEVVKVDMNSYKVIQKASLADVLPAAKPKDIRLSLDGKTLFVATGRANAIAVLDADTLQLQTSIPVGKRVWGLALSHDGKHLYTTNGASDNVSVIDTSTYKVIATIPTGKAPWGVVIDDK